MNVTICQTHPKISYSKGPTITYLKPIDRTEISFNPCTKSGIPDDSLKGFEIAKTSVSCEICLTEKTAGFLADDLDTEHIVVIGKTKKGTTIPITTDNLTITGNNGEPKTICLTVSWKAYLDSGQKSSFNKVTIQTVYPNSNRILSRIDPVTTDLVTIHMLIKELLGTEITGSVRDNPGQIDPNFFTE